MKKPEQILEFNNPKRGPNKPFIVEFYDQPPVSIMAPSFDIAEILAKAYIIHKYGIGWEVSKVISVTSGVYVGGSLEKSGSSVWVGEEEE